MIFAGNVGVVQLQDGLGNGQARFDKQAGLCATELNPRFYEQVYRGNVFGACNQASQAVTALNATATGFILSNPAGSGKNLVLLDVAVQLTAQVAASACAILCMNSNPIAAATVHTAALTIFNAFVGQGANSVAKADSSATLPATPTVVRPLPLAALGTGTSANVNLAPGPSDELAGRFVIAPGCAMSVQGSAAIAGTITSALWVELPV